MTVEDIQRLLKRLEASSGDSEIAHCLEDELYVLVLGAISLGAENPAELAKEALKAINIEFARWHA